MNIKYLCLLIVLLPMLCVIDVFSKEIDEGAVTYLDILLVSTKNDLSDLVAIAESVENYEDEKIEQFLKTLITSKLFDLHFNLTKTQNLETIGIACDTDAVFLKGIRRLYGQCQSKEDELCLELDNLHIACSATR